MTPEHKPTSEQSELFTADVIYEQTGFKLAMPIPGFDQGGRISPEFREQLDGLSEQFGFNNILPSLYVDNQGKIQLGIFLRDPDYTA